jgi:hypothetical protein
MEKKGSYDTFIYPSRRPNLEVSDQFWNFSADMPLSNAMALMLFKRMCLGKGGRSGLW